jgi:hypothetical protein
MVSPAKTPETNGQSRENAAGSRRVGVPDDFVLRDLG